MLEVSSQSVLKSIQLFTTISATPGIGCHSTHPTAFPLLLSLSFLPFTLSLSLLLFFFVFSFSLLLCMLFNLKCSWPSNMSVDYRPEYLHLFLITGKYDWKLCDKSWVSCDFVFVVFINDADVIRCWTDFVGLFGRSKNVIAKRSVEIIRKFTSASGRVITVLLGLLLKYSEIEKRHVRN